MSMFKIMLAIIFIVGSITMLTHRNVLSNIIFIVLFVNIHTWVSIHIEDVFFVLFIVPILVMVAGVTIGMGKVLQFLSAFGYDVTGSSEA